MKHLFSYFSFAIITDFVYVINLAIRPANHHEITSVIGHSRAIPPKGMMLKHRPNRIGTDFRPSPTSLKESSQLRHNGRPAHLRLFVQTSRQRESATGTQSLSSTTSYQRTRKLYHKISFTDRGGRFVCRNNRFFPLRRSSRNANWPLRFVD